jgi:hypothetical protein
MNATIGESYSVKFAKELEKFFEWAKDEEYVISSAKDGVSREWSIKLMANFEEPGRNKLEAYIRELQKTYVILDSKTKQEVEDYKILAKEYKDSGSKRKRVESESESETDVQVCNEIDTSETFYVDTLDISTDMLIKKFGEPVRTGEESDEHSFEWKLKVRDNVYTIYDWNEKDKPLSDKTWHLGSTVSDKKGVNVIKKCFKEMQKKGKKAKKETNVEEQVNVDEYEDEDCESVEINLDDLSFDE